MEIVVDKICSESGTILQQVIIRGDLLVCEISEAFLQIRKSVAGNTGIVFDLAGVSSCDTSGIQLLFALSESLKSEGRSVFSSTISDSINNVCKCLGISLDTMFKDFRG